MERQSSGTADTGVIVRQGLYTSLEVFVVAMVYFLTITFVLHDRLAPC